MKFYTPPSYLSYQYYSLLYQFLHQFIIRMLFQNTNDLLIKKQTTISQFPCQTTNKSTKYELQITNIPKIKAEQKKLVLNPEIPIQQLTPEIDSINSEITLLKSKIIDLDSNQIYHCLEGLSKIVQKSRKQINDIIDQRFINKVIELTKSKKFYIYRTKALHLLFLLTTEKSEKSQIIVNSGIDSVFDDILSSKQKNIQQVIYSLIGVRNIIKLDSKYLDILLKKKFHKKIIEILENIESLNVARNDEMLVVQKAIKVLFSFHQRIKTFVGNGLEIQIISVYYSKLVKFYSQTNICLSFFIEPLGKIIFDYPSKQLNAFLEQTNSFDKFVQIFFHLENLYTKKRNSDQMRAFWYSICFIVEAMKRSKEYIIKFYQNKDLLKAFHSILLDKGQNRYIREKVSDAFSMFLKCKQIEYQAIQWFQNKNLVGTMVDIVSKLINQKQMDIILNSLSKVLSAGKRFKSSSSWKELEQLKQQNGGFYMQTLLQNFCKKGMRTQRAILWMFHVCEIPCQIKIE